jgi:hypothetical protein
MNIEARELSTIEKNQVNVRTLEAFGDKHRVKCAERIGRNWKLPEAGEVVIIDGNAYQVEGPGKAWTSGKEMVCYLYLTAQNAAPAPAPAPAVIETKPVAKATEAQVKFAVKLGATNAQSVFDAYDDGRPAYSVEQLRNMSRSDISDLIDALKY